MPKIEEFTPAKKEQYTDDDLVYVDPETKTVVGLVEWNAAGVPKALVMPEKEAPPERADRPHRRPREKRFYPYGTYRSLKRVYQLEGKIRKSDNSATLDDVLPKALENAFWDNGPAAPAAPVEEVK